MNQISRAEQIYQSLIQQGLEYKYKKPGIYKISIADKLVYIGKSREMLKRISQHIAAIENPHNHKYEILKTAKESGYNIGFDVLYYSSLLDQEDIDNDIGEMEAEFINTHLPPLNYQIPKLGNWRSYTVNKKAHTITLEEIMNTVPQGFIF